MLSIILPSYNEEANIERTASNLKSILKINNIAYELLFVNDGSQDRTWEFIINCCKQDPNIKGVNFSRNFGKEACIFAGLRSCQGDCCIVMDCDLQHPPMTVIEMYKLWENGYEIIEGVKSTRGKERLFHKIFAELFYKTMSNFIGVDMKSSSDFKLLDRKVINILCTLPEKNTFFRALSFWAGFKTTKVSYDVLPREFGTTKWSFKKLVLYAVNNLGAFTTLPLQFITILGFLVLGLSSIYFIKILVSFILGETISDVSSLVILLLFLISSIMISLGILGYYVARIYKEVIGRPQYIISDTYNLKK